MRVCQGTVDGGNRQCSCLKNESCNVGCIGDWRVGGCIDTACLLLEERAQLLEERVLQCGVHEERRRGGV